MPPSRHRNIAAVLCARSAIVALILCIAFAAGVVRAVDEVTLDLESVAGDGWSAQGVSVRFDLPDRTRALVTVDRVRLPGTRELRDLRLRCGAVELSQAAIACRDAQLDAQSEHLSLANVAGSFVYGRRDGSMEVQLGGLRLGQGTAQIHATLRDGAWTTEATLTSVPIGSLLKLAGDWKLPLPEMSADGQVSMTLKARGAGASIAAVDVDANVAELTASNEAGSLATDKLSFALEASAHRDAPRSGDWKFRASLASDRGQAYAQPIFLDLSAHGLKLDADGAWREGRQLQLAHLQLNHQGVAQASGSAELDFASETLVRSAAVDVAAVQFPGAYAAYLQPFLLDTNFKALQTAGAASGRVEITESRPRRIDLDFQELTFDDGERNFAIGALSGEWHWIDEQSEAEDEDSDARSGNVRSSHLRWRDGALLGLDLGAADLEFTSEGRQFRLLRAARIPVLDGAIELDSFRVRNVGLPTVAFIVDATILPISVARLCAAFGWPTFGGQVGGVISKLRMREGVVTLGTTLQAQVFDGQVRISDLRLEQPFSQWPRFYANIALENLDLELVTRAFSFGLITGRLSGAVEGLTLFNWTPVAFDARLFTPPGDRSRHRISQRAVENIGSIGGGGAGVTAALSSGFLRFFEDFNYDRLGLSCRLQNEVCLMDGVAPAPNGGYYLVKGSGLPRIDVIGNSRRVDWPRLVQQLVAVTQSEGPVVR